MKRAGVECRYFGIGKNGLSGYFTHLKGLRRAIVEFQPDIIHAHYGLSGVFANLQRRVPVVTTYHGSDINESLLLIVSRWAIRLSAFNIFVSQGNIDKARPKAGKYALIPCGIDLENYQDIDKDEARKCLGWPQEGRFILFSGSFDNHVKNAPLAQAAVNLLEDATLVELKGFSRRQVAAAMCAADAFVMTSISEGSPQVVKEALACGCPVVSVDVGDVKDLTAGVEGCFIAGRSPESVADNLRKALAFNEKISGRDVIINRGLTNDRIAARLKGIYETVETVKKGI